MTSGDLSLTALIRLGKEMGVKHNTAKIFEADLKAARTADGAFLKARTRRLQVLTPAQTAAHEEAGKFIVNAKSMMTGELGSEYNQAYSEAGFQDHSLATPAAMPKRMALLERIASYLADHPQFENGPLHVTAAKGSALHARYTAARDAVLGSKTLEERLSTTRKAKREALRKRINSLQKELGKCWQTTIHAGSPSGSLRRPTSRKSAATPVAPSNCNEPPPGHRPGARNRPRLRLALHRKRPP